MPLPHLARWMIAPTSVRSIGCSKDVEQLQTLNSLLTETSVVKSLSRCSEVSVRQEGLHFENSVTTMKSYLGECQAFVTRRRIAFAKIKNGST